VSIARTNADAIHLVPGEVTPAARQREQAIKNALRQQGPATAEQVIERTELSQSATYELLEAFKVDGRRPFDPHRTVQDLISGAEER
jgi:hypothetical protein